jgi:hypothetical protein
LLDYEGSPESPGKLWFGDYSFPEFG